MKGLAAQATSVPSTRSTVCKSPGGMEMMGRSTPRRRRSSRPTANRLEVTVDCDFVEKTVSHGSHNLRCGLKWGRLARFGRLAHRRDFLGEAVSGEHLPVEVAHVGHVPGDWPCCARFRSFRVAVDHHGDIRPALNGVVRAAGFPCTAADDILTVLNFRLRPEDGHPGIGDFAHLLHALRRDGGDGDWDMVANRRKEEAKAAL